MPATPASCLRSGARLLLAGTWGLVLSACGGAPKSAPAGADVRFESESWRYQGRLGRRLTTAHYEVYTTLDDQVLLDAIPQALESAYQFYRQLVPTAREPQRRMPVYLFARRSEWADFTRRLAGPRAATLLKVRRGGYTERGVAAAEYVSHATTFPLLAHEGFHQFVDHCLGQRLPAWLNEGLAVLCEGQRWGAGGLEGFDPWHNPTRREALAEALLRNELYPLPELLRLSAGQVVGDSARRVGTYYAQLWALMLFLREGEQGRYAAGFDRLRQALGTQDLTPLAQAAFVSSAAPTCDFGCELFRSFIHDDLATVEQQYAAFMRRQVLGQRQAAHDGGLRWPTNRQPSRSMISSSSTCAWGP